MSREVLDLEAIWEAIFLQGWEPVLQEREPFGPTLARL
jgi:hypothetical protein